MRILFIHTFYKLSGGEDTVVRNEMELLKTNGHEVQLLKFKNDSLSLIKLLLLPFNVVSYLKTRKHIKSFKPDLVHIHNTHFGASPSVICGAYSLQVPIVITLHNYRMLCPSGSLYFDGSIFIDSLKSGFPWKAIKKGVYKNSKLLTFWLSFANQLHRKIGTFNKIDRFITLGEHSRELFTNSYFKKYKSKFVVKPNFSWPKTLATYINSSYFLFVGRLTKEKGIETLLKAFSTNNLPLKIAGSGPMEDEVLLTSKNHKNIEFLGQKSITEIDALLNNSKALIFPSLWFETFGMVIIEAFSKGIPVIASNLGNIKSIVENGKTGLTFETGNSRELAEMVNYYNHFTTDVKLAFSKTAIATYKEKYSPEVSIKATIEIYTQAINKHSYRL